MAKLSMIVYDTEILKGIPSDREERLPDIEYCDGWRDFENMGVSVLTAYDWQEERYRIFMADNLPEFARLVEQRDIICSFNGDGFDGPLLAANGIIVIPPAKSYDLLREVWRAAGLATTWQAGGSHAGYSLGALAKANLGRGKVGNGALAPVSWQRGQYGAVIDYCLDDTMLTRRLIELVMFQCTAARPGGYLRDPKPGDSLIPVLPVRSPLVTVKEWEGWRS